MRSKYHNTPVWRDGIKFQSKKEGDYYLYLKQLVREGKISNLRMQVEYELLPKVIGEKIKVKQLKSGPKEVKCQYVKQQATHYLADFVYTVNETGEEKVIDVKSSATKKKESYRLKKKMMLALKGIDIIEV